MIYIGNFLFDPVSEERVSWGVWFHERKDPAGLTVDRLAKRFRG
jgi:hypothetical protein